MDLFPEEKVRGGQMQPLHDPRISSAKHHKHNAAKWRAFSRMPERFELRVAILKAESMTTMDAGDQNDLFITAEVATSGEDGTAVHSKQEKTATHENAGRGGSSRTAQPASTHHPISIMAPTESPACFSCSPPLSM